MADLAACVWLVVRVAAVSKMIEEWEMTALSQDLEPSDCVFRVSGGILLVVAVVCWNELLAINNENNTRQR